MAEYVDAFKRNDFQEMATLCTGAAATYVEYLRALRRSNPTNQRPPEVKIDEMPNAGSKVDEARVRLDGKLAISDPQGDAVSLTNFLVERQANGSWLLRSYLRDGVPIGAFVVDGSATARAEAHDTWARLGVAFTRADRPDTVLAMTIELGNMRGSLVRVGRADVAFLSARGRQQTADSSFPDVHPGATADGQVSVRDVEGSAEGGRAVVRVTDTQSGVQWQLEVTVPAFAATE